MMKLMTLLILFFITPICTASQDCKDLAKFAKDVAQTMQEGEPIESQYALVDFATKNNPKAYKLLKDTVDVVYQNNMTPDRAYLSFKESCEVLEKMNIQ